MDIKSKRINWPEDDSWWEILEEMPYGVSRKLAAVLAKYVNDMEAAFEANVVVLINCTTAWSFSNEITEED